MNGEVADAGIEQRAAFEPAVDTGRGRPQLEVRAGRRVDARRGRIDRKLRECAQRRDSRQGGNASGMRLLVALTTPPIDCEP